MTKTEAAEKVAKLRRLVKGTTNEHEAASARANADKLITEHKLTGNDLTSGEKAATFDDLIDALHHFTLNHPALPDGMFGTSKILQDVLTRIKNIGRTDKILHLNQLTSVIRTASIFAGNNSSIREIKRILDETLRRHEIML